MPQAWDAKSRDLPVPAVRSAVDRSRLEADAADDPHPEQHEFRAVVRQFAEDKLAPLAAETDRGG